MWAPALVVEGKKRRQSIGYVHSQLTDRVSQSVASIVDTLGTSLLR